MLISFETNVFLALYKLAKIQKILLRSASFFRFFKKNHRIPSILSYSSDDFRTSTAF